ncbi:MAG: winged helix DNA-binding domain-containing protein [Verrucomicrobia bacterium]|nr:winged helix DNA-binding domain-containing protein [Verrucomicrobiota bacterium]
MSEIVPVSRLAARRFLRQALLLDTPAPNVAAALSHLGYVQIDPINVCGRMHDHILRLRVAGYREGDLMRHLHGDRAPLPAEQRLAFEHHLPTPQQILVAFPVTAWPHLLAAMQARTRRAGAWSGRLTPRERELAPSLLAELAARGPLGSEDLHDGRQARRVWGSMTLAKSTLQKMFFHGRLLIAGRDQNRRLYHLPERVLPAAVLRQPVPPARDTAQWLARTKLQQRRLTTLMREEVAAMGEEARRVAVEGCPPLYILKEDLPHLLSAAEPSNRQPSSPIPSVQLLGPLDPLIYERRVTRSLWDFDYTWEAYTPAAKRVRGHYSLPILAGCELVGHVDPKADRERRRLRVVSRRLRRGHKVAGAVRELARFLGLR